MEGRTSLRRPGADVELLESPDLRVALWKVLGGAQRFVSVELLGGEHVGLIVYIPVEALTGEGLQEPSSPELVIVE